MPLQSHSTDETSAYSDPTDEIASLLASELDEDGTEDVSQESTLSQEQTNDEDILEDSEEADELTDDSTEEDDSAVDESDTDNTDEEEQALYEMLGVEENQLSMTDDGDFMINVKVDGEQGQRKLADLIKSYQTESSVTKKSMALAEERKAFETQATAKAQEINQTLERNQNLAKVLEQEVMADFEKVDWDDLRQYDPAEWTAKQQEFSTKYNKIQRVQQELEQQAAEAAEAENLKNVENQKAYLKGQYEKMLEANPTWQDKAKFSKDMSTLRDFAMTTYGFSESDMDAVVSAGVIEVLKDAQQFRKGSKVAQKKMKKPLPKMQKRGKGGRYVKSKVSKLDKLTKAAKSAQGSARRDLQRDAVAELLTGG